jgi:phytanoyl-CoA hydroxylase
MLTRLLRQGRRSFSTSALRTLSDADKAAFHRDGFILVDRLITEESAMQVRDRFDDLFAGKFDTGIYPDEWHWREGLSFPHVAREIVNSWKSDTTIAKVALSESIGYLVADLMGWATGTRMGQDDALWKPPGAGGVGWHQDAAYISDQFVPLDNNSVTVWIALDDADEETGVVQYAKGSHVWSAEGGALHNVAESSFHGSEDLQASVKDAAAKCGETLDISSVAVPIGSAIVHHQNVWHGSAPNVSRMRPRRALALHLLRKDVMFRPDPKPDYIYGRYQIGDSQHVEDAFFPVLYS